VLSVWFDLTDDLLELGIWTLLSEETVIENFVCNFHRALKVANVAAVQNFEILSGEFNVFNKCTSENYDKLITI
jgi:hypothetical protein